MKLQEYIEKTGVRISHLCKECQINRNTIARIRRGLPVSAETSDRIALFTRGVVVPAHLGRHISRRKKLMANRAIIQEI